MEQYRLQPGTSSKIYELLTIKDDGTMTMEFHGTDRTLVRDVIVNDKGWIVSEGAMYPPLSSGKWRKVECPEIVPHDVRADLQSERNEYEDLQSDNERITDAYAHCDEIVNPAEHEEATTDGTDKTDNYIEPVGLGATNFTNCTNLGPAEQNDAPTEDESVESVQSVVENTSAVSRQSSAIEQDLFAQMQAEIAELRKKNEDLCNMIQTRTEVRTAHESFDTENRSCATQGRPSLTPRQRRRRSVAVETPAAQSVATEQDSDKAWVLKALGIAAASVVALVIIYNTGLLIPMGLIGLGASGLLK